MAKIDIKQILTAAVIAGVTQAAQSAATDTTAKDVPIIVETTKEIAHPAIKEAQAQIDHATSQEPFYLSRQWWTAMLGIAGSLAGVTGIAFPAEMQAQVLAAIMAIIGAVSAVTLLYNRYFAKKPIGQ